MSAVHIRRGIFQSDSISPLQIVTALLPTILIIRKINQGDSLGKGKINHLLSMGDLKWHGCICNEIDSLVQTVKVISEDIVMRFGIEK